MIICFLKGATLDLSTAIKEISNESGFCELESPSEVKLLSFPNSESFENYNRGFIFNEDFELKWMKFDSYIHIVFTGKEEKLPSLNWQGKRKLIRVNKDYETIYLWHNESRVNQNVEYPVKGKNIKIVSETLKEEKENEESNFIVKRFVKLEGENG